MSGFVYQEMQQWLSSLALWERLEPALSLSKG
jgi:hypothetical protein